MDTLHVILVYVILSTPLLTYSQIPFSPNQYDDNGKKTGKWTVLFDENWLPIEDSSKASYYRTVTYKNGLPKGKVIDYYMIGIKQWEGYLISDEPDSSHGKCIYYYENGNIESAGRYVNNQEHGVWRYWTEDGRMISKEKFKFGYLEGYNKYIDDAYEVFYHDQFDIAKKYAFRSLKKVRKSFMVKESDYADALLTLGILYYELMEYYDVKELFYEIARLRYQYNGPCSSEYFVALQNLAILCEELNEFQEADTLYQDAILIIKQVYGEDHFKYNSLLCGYAG